MLIGRSKRKMQNGWRNHFLNPQRIQRFIPYVAHIAQLADKRCEEIPLLLVKVKDKRAISLCNVARRPLHIEFAMAVPFQKIIIDRADDVQVSRNLNASAVRELTPSFRKIL